MIGENINKSGPRVLVAPLDWGLGHATRCIPIIYELIRQGSDAWIGTGQSTKKLLQAEFPQANFLELPDYNITYSKGSSQWAHLLKQGPKALKNSRQEHRLLENYIDKYHFDAVISDNRPGLWSKKVHTVYITHQLNFVTGNTFLDKALHFAHKKVISHFTECWVPDDVSHSLSGMLSRGAGVKYCGPLSSLEKKITEKNIDWLLLLSGPEPQRSLLELRLLEIFQGQNAVLVRGIDDPFVADHHMAEVRGIASRKEVEELISRSKMVICRAGYSSIMDLSVMQAEAVLVPTPGQAEQEYLAKLHSEAGVGMVTQNELSFESINRRSGKLTEIKNNLLVKRITDLLASL